MRKFILFDLQLLSLFCGILSGMYMIEYLVQFAGITTPISGILNYFTFFENLITSSHQNTITLVGKIYSNNYLYCSLVFIISSLIIPHFAYPINWICDHIDNIIAFFRRIKEAINKFFIDRQTVQSFSKSKSYYISLKLDLKNVIQKSNPKNVLMVREKAYQSFAPLFQEDKTVETSIKGDKLIIISKDFKKIDETFIEFMKQVQKITKANAEAQIATTAYFVLDVLEGKNFDDSDIEFIEKVLKYDYKNKVITTSFFAEKYRTEINGKFQATSLGTVRIYKDTVVKPNEVDIFDDTPAQTNEYKDYEFHVFARKVSNKK